MDLHVIMGTFYPLRSTFSFSPTFAFQVMQNPMSWEALLGSLALQALYAHCGPRSHLKPDAEQVIPIAIYHYLLHPLVYEEWSCTGQHQGGESSSCSTAGDQPSNATSALTHHSHTSHPLQDTHNDTLKSKSSIKTEEGTIKISGGYPILLAFALNFLK